MIIHKLVVGMTEANCYLVGCSQTKEAVVIDPGAEANRIKHAVSDLGLKPKYIINTHGHADHIGANRDVGLPVLIHSRDADFLKNPNKNMSLSFGFFITSPKAERLLNDGDKINIGDLVLEILHTPGHTPGGISIRTNGVVFTGDTLFAGGIGRADLPGSSEKDLLDSIRNKLLVLDDDTVVYPGHGPSSTIGEEKRANPFL